MMGSRGLASHINYLGMERCVRKIILKNNLVTEIPQELWNR